MERLRLRLCSVFCCHRSNEAAGALLRTPRWYVGSTGVGKNLGVNDEAEHDAI